MNFRLQLFHTMAKRKGSEILDLFLTTFSGHKDEYGKDVVPPLPLYFVHVNEGQRPLSSAFLSRFLAKSLKLYHRLLLPGLP